MNKFNAVFTDNSGKMDIDLKDIQNQISDIAVVNVDDLRKVLQGFGFDNPSYEEYEAVKRAKLFNGGNMKIELKDITLVDKHPDGDDLNKDYVGIEIAGEVKCTANIDELIKALELMRIRK